MKKIRCPRCDNPLFFDETKYLEGQSLHFHCTECGRNFSIRNPQMENPDDEKKDFSLGDITVLENDYCYKQVFPLLLGENIIGRRSKGTGIQIPIDSGDDNLARNHCVIHIKENKKGKLQYTINDFPSRAGTFLNGRQLDKNERTQINNDDMIVIGSTTVIVHIPQTSEEKGNE